MIGVLLNAVSEGIVLLGKSGEMVRLNDCACQVLRLNGAEALGEPFLGLFLESELRGPNPDGLWDEPATLDTLATRGDGSKARVGLQITPVRAPGKSPEGFVVVIEDLDEKRRAEEQIRLIDRLASLGELSASVAHEIRNPLAGIQTSAEVLAERLVEEDPRREFVKVILEEVRRLDRIVKDLVRFAKPPPPELGVCDLRQVVEKALALLSKTTRSQSVKVLSYFDPDLDPIEADADQMLQVILNIALNSVQAMPNGGVLQIRTLFLPPEEAPVDAREAKGGVARVEVIDTGHGIDPTLQHRVFDPFYTTKAGGTGMGLTICQRIVEGHGGTVSLESTPNQETHVWVDLPVRRSVSTTAPAQTRARVGDGSQRQ